MLSSSSQTHNNNESSQPIITATSLDSFSDIFTKYGTDVRSRLLRLKNCKGVKLIHGLDATQLSTTDHRLLGPSSSLTSSNIIPFTHIIFNFPHVGQTQNPAPTLELISSFFVSSLPFLSHPNSRIHLALRSTPFYREAFFEPVMKLAQSSGLRIVEQLPFEWERWAALGYAPSRTSPAGGLREAPPVQEAVVFVLMRDTISRENETNTVKRNKERRKFPIKPKHTKTGLRGEFKVLNK